MDENSNWFTALPWVRGKKCFNTLSSNQAKIIEVTGANMKMMLADFLEFSYSTVLCQEHRPISLLQHWDPAWERNPWDTPASEPVHLGQRSHIGQGHQQAIPIRVTVCNILPHQQLQTLLSTLVIHTNPCGVSTMEKGRSAKKTTFEAFWPWPVEESDYVTLCQEVVFWALIYWTGYSCLGSYTPQNEFICICNTAIKMAGDDGEGNRRNGKRHMFMEACLEDYAF